MKIFTKLKKLNNNNYSQNIYRCVCKINRVHILFCFIERFKNIDMILSVLGYEPADLTVHPPPPRTAEGGFIFFV